VLTFDGINVAAEPVLAQFSSLDLGYLPVTIAAGIVCNPPALHYLLPIRGQGAAET